METIHTIAWMKEAAAQARAEGRIVGLVPTMGALHEGHLSLVHRAQADCNPVVVSLFVNPAQFSPKEDLAKYPRTLKEDAAKLTAMGADCLFAPEAAEMYPRGFRSYVHVEGLSERLEGRSRPGHFRGVTTVVLKLLEIVRPHFAYFGRKDAQQARIIQQMVNDLNLVTEIVVCPIVREADGLAMSSRNAYLKPEERRAATALYKAMDAVRKEMASGVRDALQLQAVMRRALAAEPLVTPDYAEIVDANTFEPVMQFRCSCYVLLAAFLGSTRLIDNMRVETAGDDMGDLRFHL